MDPAMGLPPTLHEQHCTTGSVPAQVKPRAGTSQSTCADWCATEVACHHMHLTYDRE